jgi:hypothetical protein
MGGMFDGREVVWLQEGRDELCRAISFRRGPSIPVAVGAVSRRL